MSSSDHDRWVDNLSVIRDYLDQRLALEQLCSEVSFILEKRCAEVGIELANITSRVKSITSVLEKIERKGYVDPLRQITDLAGVRVVYLYRSDAAKLKRIVRADFDVVEATAKRPVEDDRFGYDATHYLVRVQRDTSGARYEDLKHLLCEIQIRTVLQDAWAIIDHHLRYKTEAQVPPTLRRRLHALAAMLENADGQFDQISVQRRRYVSKLHSRRTSLREVLDEPVNRDSLLVYAKRKFSDMKTSSSRNHISYVVDQIDPARFAKVADIDTAFERTRDIRSLYKRDRFADTALAHIALAIGCVDRTYRERTVFGDEAKRVLAAYDERTDGDRQMQQ